MALNYLGYMLADRGTRLDESLGYIRRAVALDPNNGAYLDSLGWAYYKMGNYDLAEENLRRASERIGNDPTVHDHLGELYQKTGRLKFAATNWERRWKSGTRPFPPKWIRTASPRYRRNWSRPGEAGKAEREYGSAFETVTSALFGTRRCCGSAFCLLSA